MIKRGFVALLLIFSLPIVVGKARQQSINTDTAVDSSVKSNYYTDLTEEDSDEFENDLVVRCFTYTPDDVESALTF